MLLMSWDLYPLHQQSGRRWFHFTLHFGMSMEGRVEWTGGTNLIGVNSNEQIIEIDWENGPSPMQIALQSIGACSIVDVVIGLKDRNFSKVWVELSSTRNDEPPRYFTTIHMTYHVVGDVPKKLVERVVEKSHEKYCSVSQSIRKDCKITHETVIHDSV